MGVTDQPEKPKLEGSRVRIPLKPGATSSASAFENLLREFPLPYSGAESIFLDLLTKEKEEREEADRAYLQSLSQRRRRLELRRRRVRRLKFKAQRWWEENVAWRLAARQRDDVW